MFLEKCCNLKLNDSSHTYELNKIKKIIQDYEKICEKIKDTKWDDVEEQSKKLLSDTSAFIEL